MNQQLRIDMVRCGQSGNRERNDLLYQAVKAGDEAAREQMIQENMSLVLTKVKAFLATRPELKYLRDDLVAAGFIGLTQAVNAMKDHDTDDAYAQNPTGYLNVAILNELTHLADEESTVSIPWQTQSKGRRLGEELRRPEPSGHLPEEVVRMAPDHATLIELRDLIESCCTKEHDRRIVALREENHTQAQTAAILGVSVSYVCKRLQAIYARLQRKMAE
jgi:RNA polymerase sigma factor (sigma-70 family)